MAQPAFLLRQIKICVPAGKSCMFGFAVSGANIGGLFLAEIFAVQIGQHSILSSAHPAAVRNKIVIYTLSKRFYGGRIALSLFAYKIVSRAWPLRKKIV